MADKLTDEQRQTLYNPLTYEVKRVNESVYRVESMCTGLIFYAKRMGQAWRVASPSGTTYEIDIQFKCYCPDSPKAIKYDRFCKHKAVVLAVVRFIENENNRRPVEEVRKELKEMFHG